MTALQNMGNYIADPTLTKAKKHYRLTAKGWSYEYGKCYIYTYVNDTLSVVKEPFSPPLDVPLLLQMKEELSAGLNSTIEECSPDKEYDFLRCALGGVALDIMGSETYFPFINEESPSIDSPHVKLLENTLSQLSKPGESNDASIPGTCKYILDVLSATYQFGSMTALSSLSNLNKYKFSFKNVSSLDTLFGDTQWTTDGADGENKALAYDFAGDTFMKHVLLKDANKGRIFQCLDEANAKRIEYQQPASDYA